MNKNYPLYLIALHNFPKFGPVSLKRLKKYFKNWENAYKGSPSEIMRAGIKENVALEFAEHRKKINPEELIEKLIQENIGAVALQDDDYPKRLAEIYEPPPLLFYKGKLVQNEHVLGVVGTRKYTRYGQQTAENFVTELCRSGLTIASGMALGIDTVAHCAAIQAGGRTIAVLGSGIDQQNIYPATNQNLARQIVEKGGLIFSEFPIGTPALKHNFPQRNRIISGLSLGVLVIEAGEKSGSLITANCALEQNREVFAVPGNIYSPVSAGTNALINQGAKMAVNAEDILESLNLKQADLILENKNIIPATKEEEEILKTLSHESKHINDIIRETGLNASLVGSTLIMMEMKGMVKNDGGGEYRMATRR
ncbi:MAG: DNA-processing protein DprA [bacterium]